MKHSARIFLGLSTAVLAIAAQAGGLQARDVPRITNGGSGVIGSVEPDAYPRQANPAWTSNAAPANSNAWNGQTARTMPEAQAQSTWNNTSAMGASRAQPSTGLAPRHAQWGTPD